MNDLLSPRCRQVFLLFLLRIFRCNSFLGKVIVPGRDNGYSRSRIRLMGSNPMQSRNSSSRADIVLDSSVSFFSPLLHYGYRTAVEQYENGTMKDKPILLYLPGFDGSFLSPFLQFPEMNSEFDVRCMSIPAHDRSTYEQLKDAVMKYINTLHEESLGVEELNREETASKSDTPENSIKMQNPLEIISSLGRKGGKTSSQMPKGRQIYLAGESFGGILASDVALSLLQEEVIRVKGLVLINAATRFDRSRLAAVGPDVAKLAPWLYPTNGLRKLLPLFTDKYSLSQLLLILQAKALPSVINTATREAYMGRVAFSLPFVLPSMPQETFDWRLREWLQTGTSIVTPKLNDFNNFTNFPTLVVAGEEDACLPSIDEAERLSRMLPMVNVHVVEGAGHASTCGSRVDLTALMRSAFGLSGRQAMSKIASSGTGEYFGMEPRYDNATIGLSPFSYWSKRFYRRCKL